MACIIAPGVQGPCLHGLLSLGPIYHTFKRRLIVFHRLASHPVEHWDVLNEPWFRSALNKSTDKSWLGLPRLARKGSRQGVLSQSICRTHGRECIINSRGSGLKSITTTQSQQNYLLQTLRVQGWSLVHRRRILAERGVTLAPLRDRFNLPQ